jgi:anaerobic ribonucleoside-triphosphate reductase
VTRIRVAPGDDLGYGMLERWCIACGRFFYTNRVESRFCGRACQMRAWRAAKKLEGTHGMRDGFFRRLADT